MRNAIRRRSGHGFSKRRAEPRTWAYFSAGENRRVDESACPIDLDVIMAMEMFICDKEKIDTQEFLF